MAKSSLQAAAHPKQPERNRAQQLLDEGRSFCYFVGVDCYVEGKGWRPSIVFENEPGHYPNGGGDVEPWYWGRYRSDYQLAQDTCREKNKHMGVDEDEALHIVASSMSVSRKEVA